MRASRTVRLGSAQGGEACLTSAASRGQRGAARCRPFVTIKEMDGEPGQLQRRSLKGVESSLLNRRV